MGGSGAWVVRDDRLRDSLAGRGTASMGRWGSCPRRILVLGLRGREVPRGKLGVIKVGHQ